MARKFIYDGKPLDDPDPSMKIDEVRQSYAEYFPELYNAEHTEKKDGEDTVITFTKRVGTKGSLAVDLQLFNQGGKQQTNFGTKLIQLILKADSHNKELIRQGFPNAVKLVEHWEKTGQILDLKYD